MKSVYAWSLITVMASAVISLFISWQAGVFVLLFSLVAWWVWKNPEGGFLLLIVLAPILPMLKITQTIGTVTLIKDVIILTLLLKQVIWPLLNKQLLYRRNILWLPLLTLGGWASVEMIRADSLLLGVLRARDIGLYAMLYLAVLYLPFDYRIVKERVVWFTAGLLALLGLGIYQWQWAMDSAVLRFDPAREIWIPRLSSVMAHPSIFGQYLVLAASLLIALTWLASSKKWRLFWGSLIVIVLPFVFLTYSRAVWIGLVAAGGAMGLGWLAKLAVAKTSRMKLGKYVLISTAAGILVLVILIRLTPAGVFIRSAFDPTYGSNEERIIFMARLVGQLDNTEVLLGRGLGDVLEQNFRKVNLAAYDIASGASRVVQLEKNKTLVDNQYIKTLVEMGLVGLLIYGWIYWRFLKSALRITNYELRIARVIGWLGIGFLAAFVVQGLFIDIWDIFPTNAYFWIVAGLLGAAETKWV